MPATPPLSTGRLSTGAYQRRSTCRGCLSERLVSFLDYGQVPLAGDFIQPHLAGSEKVYPMDLCVCLDCSLTQILNVVDADELFTDYRYLSSITKTLTGHFKDYAKVLKNEVLEHADDLVVEFGCNDGVLLSPLKELGVRAIGVDAAENVVKIARGKGLHVQHGYFGQEIAGSLRADHGAAKVITASNVFAHIDNLDEVMRGVDSLLDEDGTFVVEVHYVLDLLDDVQFETVYHEHLCYYSLHSLDVLFKRFGLEVVDAERLLMHGGAIRVFGKRISQGAERSKRSQQLFDLEQRSHLFDESVYQQFGEKGRKVRKEIRDFVLSRKAMGRSISGYGAAGRATTLLNFCGLGADVIDYVVDESPSRIGRIVPGVQIPVVPRSHFHEQPTDDCLLTAWNYRQEIVAKEPAFLEQGGCFLAPLPEIEVIEGRTSCLKIA